MKNAIVALMAVMLFTSSIASVQSRKVSHHRLVGLEHRTQVGATPQELIDSFVDGFGLDNMVENSTACIHKSEKGAGDISEAINHLIYRGWTWENYIDLLASLGHVTPVTRTCFDVSLTARAKLTQFFGSFDSFVDFANQLKNGIIVNAWEWYPISSAIVSAIQNNRPTEIAFQAGKAVKLLFNFNPVLKSQKTEAEITALPDLRPIEDFLTAFLEGSRVFDSDNIKNCMNETEFLVKSVEDANREFSKRTDSGFRNGIFEVADVFERLKPLNVWCYDGVNDVTRIILNMYNTFNSPIDIVINATRHATQLSASALGLWQGFRNGNWKTVGRESGTIFYYVFTTG